MVARVVVIQPESYYGAALAKIFAERGWEVVPLSDTALVGGSACEVIGAREPALVAVAAFSVDASVAQAAVDMCSVTGVPLVALSSHHVFGVHRSEAGLAESAEVAPTTPQQQQLVAVEQAFLSYPKSLVLRLPWVVDDTCDALLFRVADQLLEGGKLMVCDHWRGCPVDTQDVVRVVVAIAQQVSCGAENWGMFHLHASDDCSEAEFADYVRRILRKAGCTGLAEMVTVGWDYRFMLTNGWLAGHRCTNEFGIQLRSWRQGIKAKLTGWLAQQVAEGRVQLHPEQKEEPFTG